MTSLPTRHGKVFTAAEVAVMLGCTPSRVEWHCAAALRAGRLSFFWGSWQEAKQGWLIPERTLRRALGAYQFQHYTVAEVAALTRLSERTIRSRLVTVPAGVAIDRARPPHMLGARLFFGSDLRVPESELSRLTAGAVPGWPKAA